MTIIMIPDYPESFDEEQRNLSLIIKPLGEKESLSFLRTLNNRTNLQKH